MIRIKTRVSSHFRTSVKARVTVSITVRDVVRVSCVWIRLGFRLVLGLFCFYTHAHVHTHTYTHTRLCPFTLMLIHMHPNTRTVRVGVRLWSVLVVVLSG